MAGMAIVAEVAVIAPVTVPLAVGWKMTPTEQLAPEARLWGQVFCTMLNWALTDRRSEEAAKLAVLLTATVCTALDWPGATAGKVNWAGFTSRPDATCPVPLSGTLTTVTPRVEDETTNVAALPPPTAGVKTTCTVQLLPLASTAPQVVVAVVKLPAAGPVTWKPTLAIGAPPVLLTVRVDGALATPTC
jgi:hypothetical protein